MRLQQLELKGFKSFANETHINFNEDIIGVVGPNGSGKSNVVDAIRWVLGEQKSKELRLEKMTSVIFNGSKKRKQAGMASVSLTFENTKNILPTEYQTVKITRILYRNGDSEYRLNNVQCRLKDITSLFLDTGIGSNSYAIIHLGMVDDLLQDKENSRRMMFEQAAGISKYKKRKRETLNKLKNTSADLDRIEDLLFEIQNNLKTLEKQAKRTKRFYEIKAQYKELSIELAIHSLANYKDKHKQLKTQLEQEKDQYTRFETSIRQLEAALENEKKANLDKEKALSDRQRDLNSLVGNIRGMESDKKMLEQKKQFLLQSEVKLNNQIAIAKGRIETLEQDIDRYRQSVNNEKRLEEALEKELDAAEEKLQHIKTSHATLKTDLDSIVGQQQRLERAVFELEKQKAIHSNQINNLKNEVERDQHSIQDRQGERDSLVEKLKELQQQESTLKKSIEELEKKEEEREKAIETTKTKLESLKKAVADVNRKLDAKRNEFNLTKSLVDNLEGFPESIRFLSNAANWKKDVPLLSDIIYCKEEYRVAIENYLEPYLNYYVVQSFEDAYQAIQLLNKTQKGKANFFVLEAFKSYEPPMVLLPDTQRAIELVEVDAPYRKLCNYLLESVLVTDKDQPSQQIGDSNIVILSKSGGFVKKRFSVSGGSVGLFEGKRIGRKKNLELLEIAIKKLEREETKVSGELFSIQSKIQVLESESNTQLIRQNQKQLNQILQQIASISARLENSTTFINQLNEKRTRNEGQIQNLSEKITQFEHDLLDKSKAVQQSKDQISNTDGSFRKVAEELSQASSNFNEKNIAFIRQQNKVTSLQRELSFREKQISETNENLRNDQSSLGKSSEEIQYIEDQLTKIQEELLEKYALKKERSKFLTEAEQNYFQARGSINEIEDQLRKTNRKSQDSQILINNLKDKFTDVKFQIQSIGERLKIEFNVAVNDVINQEPNPSYQKEELQVKVDRLRSRLDNYGEINPMAVEAYDEMNERYETITTQRDDILAAKSSLLDTIKEIEETATIRFLEAFDLVRTHFVEVFRSLFTEDDNCDLLLDDPENPLESKIKIVAKPKGKRPQSISQLSGGEKTLTATALLFALYLLKPAPFCIFDEVDAPLDDANIDKFNRIIQKFSKDSQFIIVTHNKQTMAAVDTIYGVYMPEQGVSSVSPVDFRSLEHNSSFVQS